MAGLQCPHCGAYTSFEPVRVKGASAHDVVTGGKMFITALATTEGSKDEPPYFAILECQACRRDFVARKISPTIAGWKAVYPLAIRAVPDGLPDNIASAFKEAALCFAVEAYQGCLLMARTALIRLQRERGVSSLQELHDKGKISESLYQKADEVRLWANMIGHEDVAPDVVQKEDCEELLAYLEELLHAIYTAPAKLDRLTQKRKTSPKSKQD